MKSILIETIHGSRVIVPIKRIIYVREYTDAKGSAYRQVSIDGDDELDTRSWTIDQLMEIMGTITPPDTTTGHRAP